MADQRADCVFCRIAAGELPASGVYEDDRIIGIMDIRPVNEGHVLVIPKRHAPSLEDLDEPTGQQLLTVAMRLASAIRASGVRCEGINLFLADGEVAGQEVLHVHLHVIPRFKGDSFKISADWSNQPPREELDGIAEQIRVNLPDKQQ